MAEATSKLQILVQLRDEASSAMRSLSNSINDLGGGFNFSFGKAEAFASAIGALGAGAIMGKAISAFGDAEVKMGNFDATMKTLPPGLQILKTKILETAEQALNKFGFDNEEAAASMGRLLQVTQSGSLTFDAFQAAMDLARAKGIGLEDAARLVSLALQGNARFLKEYGIVVDEHASKETILASIQKQLAGQAETYSQKLWGNIDVMKAFTGEILEAIGLPFGETIKDIIEKIREWIKQQGGINSFIDKHNVLISTAAGILNGIFLASIIFATSAFLAMAGPLGVIIAGIMALIGLGSALAVAWSTNFLHIRGIVESVVNFITGLFRGLINVINEVISAVSRVVSSVGSIGGSVLGSIGSVLGLAEGGIVTHPTFAMVGEAGPEAVIPLNRLRGAGGGGINVYLQGDFYTDTETAERFANKIAKLIGMQIRL